MTTEEYLQRKINTLDDSIRVYKVSRNILIGLAILAFLISFQVIKFRSFNQDRLTESLKFGFATLTTILTLGIQGYTFLKKGDRLNLTWAKDNINQYDTMNAAGKKLFDEIVKKIP